MTDAIVMRNVRKTFGKKVAVEGLDLVIPQGQLVGVIGPNGAGKSTSIRMIMSILFPDSGELSVLGKASAVESKDQIGYLPEERGVYKKMKVSAFLRHMAGLKGVTRNASARIATWLDRVELQGVGNKKCEELSKGMQQKVQFIASVIHEPRLLILDEPFSGLDPVNMRLLKELIREQHERGVTVLFSTHVMLHAETMCDHIVMIHQGRKVLDGTINQIRAAHDTRTIAFHPANPGFAPAELSATPGLGRVVQGDDGFEAEVLDGHDPSAALAALAAAVPVTRIALHRASLEDIFIGIVTGGASGDGSGPSEEQLRAAVRAGQAAELQESPA